LHLLVLAELENLRKNFKKGFQTFLRENGFKSSFASASGRFARFGFSPLWAQPLFLVSSQVVKLNRKPCTWTAIFGCRP